MGGKQADTILNYHVVFEEQPDGGYTVTVPSLQGCITEGDTFEEAKSNAAEAISVYVESLMIDGLEVPRDSSVIVETIHITRPSLASL